MASRLGVSRRAVTLTARNARRFVRHGVSTNSWTPQRRPRLYINHFGRWPSCRRPSTTYPRPFVLTPHPPLHLCTSRHIRTAAIHPLLGLAYVRPVRQPVLLTDVRIDNLCLLIMTVRSRARRYLTVRVIAISSSTLRPATPRKSAAESSKISNFGSGCPWKCRRARDAAGRMRTCNNRHVLSKVSMRRSRERPCVCVSCEYIQPNFTSRFSVLGETTFTTLRLLQTTRSIFAEVYRVG